MNAMEEARLWATDFYFDEQTRIQAGELMNDPDQLAAAFGSELAFGTGGLRGILGTGCARMNRYTVARATMGLGRYLLDHHLSRGVAIAHDSRHGSEEFTAVTAGVLAAMGIRAYGSHAHAQLCRACFARGRRSDDHRQPQSRRLQRL